MTVFPGGGSLARASLRGIADQLVEEILLLRGERQLWRDFRHSSIEHSHPEDPPTEQAQDRK
jgi:hypothetical protein